MTAPTKQPAIDIDTLIGAGILIVIYGFPAYMLVAILLDRLSVGTADGLLLGPIVGLLVLVFSVVAIWREQPK